MDHYARATVESPGILGASAPAPDGLQCQALPRLGKRSRQAARLEKFSGAQRDDFLLQALIFLAQSKLFTVFGGFSRLPPKLVILRLFVLLSLGIGILAAGNPPILAIMLHLLTRTLVLWLG